MDFSDLTIEQISDGLRGKKFSSVELTRSLLERIDKLNPQLGAVLNIRGARAIEQAEEADQRLAAGQQGELLGVPAVVKDNMVMDQGRTTAGSKILEDYRAPYTATAVKKLQEAGSPILGKANLDEFAMGASTENSGFLPAKNPWDMTRVPGGSSGGSVVSVSAGIVPYALGSDTGGSIRQPAGFCGVVGLKPTYGRVSRRGLIALASSLDQIGPVTRTVKDAAIVLGHIAGRDEKDATSVERPENDFVSGIEDGIKGLRVGVPKEFFVDGMEPGVRERVEQAIAQLKELGAEIVDVSLPSLKHALATYYIILPVEAASNLGRYDGIKYGLSKQDEAHKLLDVYLQTREEGFGAEPKRRIILGTYASSAGYYDAYYKKALEVQQVIRNEMKEVFKKVDLLAGPTSPTVAFPLGEKADDPLAMYLADVFTVPVNIAGLPGISVPCGMSENLPVGLQLIAPWWEEARLLRAAYTYEQANEYYKMRPKLDV